MMNGHQVQATNYPMTERRSEGGDSRAVNLEDLRSRESTRISTAEDVKALLEAEFRGIAEIQRSQKLSEQEFKLIENLYWNRVGQEPDGRIFYAGERSDVRSDVGNFPTTTRSLQQSSGRTFPEGRLIRSDFPQDSNSLRHETKLKRHVLEEVVLEDSDKFYESTLPKRTKKVYQGPEKSSSSGELRHHYYNNDALPSQSLQRDINLDQPMFRDQYLLPSAKPRHAKKHQSEIILGDTLNNGVDGNAEMSRRYVINKENLDTTPKDYNFNVYANNQQKQNELLVEDVQTFRDNNDINAPLKMRNHFENEIEQSTLEKEKNRKSRLEGTETHIRSKSKVLQGELVLDDKLLIQESQIASAKKWHKKPSHTARISGPKFKNRFRRSKKASKNNARLDYSEEVHSVPILLSSRKNQEEVVLDNLDTFSETTFTKKKELETSSSLEKAQKKLNSIEHELYTQSLSRFQPIEQKGPQKEIYLSGQEIVSETTLTRPKKYKLKKSPKLMADVTDLSKQILETERKQNSEENAVVLTKVVHKEPQYSYEDNQQETGESSRGIDVNGYYVEENKKKICRKSKTLKPNGGKAKLKKSLFKKRKNTSEIVIEDSEIFEDHNKPKKIHLSPGGVVHLAELDGVDLPDLDDEEKEIQAAKNEKLNKKKNNKKLKKLKKQGETIVDKSFVYEDAGNIGLPSTTLTPATPVPEAEQKAEIPFQEHQANAVVPGKKATIEVAAPNQDAEEHHFTESETLNVASGVKRNINILNIQEETIVNDNYFVADDTKLKLTSNRTDHSEVEEQKEMEKKQKEDKDGKVQKLKVKLPGINFKRKSKSSEPKEETSTSKTLSKDDHKQNIEEKQKSKPNVVVDSTKENINIETTENDSKEIVEIKDKKEDGKNRFKFNMPDIHIAKPSFKSKTIETKIEDEKSETVRTQERNNIETAKEEAKEIVEEDKTKSEDLKEKKEGGKHRFKFHLPDIRSTKPTFKSKTVEEKIEDGIPETVVTQEKINIERKKEETKEDKDKKVSLELKDKNESVEEKQEDGKQKFKFRMPDIHIAKPSFKSKTVGEKIVDGKTETTVTETGFKKDDDVLIKNDLAEPSLNVSTENKEITLKEKEIVKYEIDNFQKDNNIAENIILPNISITKNTKDSEKIINEKEVKLTDIENKDKPKEKVVFQTPQEEIINDQTILLEKTTEEKKSEKSDKKFKFNFPHINIPKPHFGKKSKERPKEEIVLDKSIEIVEENKQSEPSDSRLPNADISIKGPELEIKRHDPDLKIEVQTKDAMKKEQDKSFTHTSSDFSVTKPELPELPPPPVFRKAEETPIPQKTVVVEGPQISSTDERAKETVEFKSQDKAFDTRLPEVSIPKPNLNLKLSADEKVIDDEKSKKGEITETIKKDSKDTKFVIPNAADSSEKREVVVVAEIPSKEICEITKEKDEKVSDKKFKFNFPHFNIPKPNFTLKKNKEQKNDKESKAPEEIVTVISPNPQNDANTNISEVEIDKKIAEEKPQKDSDTKYSSVMLPDALVTKPKLPDVPPISIRSKKTEISKMEDDVFVEETSLSRKEVVKSILPDDIKSPETDAPKADATLKLKADSPKPRVNEKVDLKTEESNITKPDFPSLTTKENTEKPSVGGKHEKVKIEENINKGNIEVKIDEKKDTTEIDNVKVADKKFKFNFPNINIPKPNFGKKNKEKQKDQKGIDDKKTIIIEESKPKESSDVILSNVDINAPESEKKEESASEQQTNLDLDKIEPEQICTIISPDAKITKPKRPEIPPVSISLKKSEETPIIQKTVVVEGPQISSTDERAKETVEFKSQNKAFDTRLPEVNIPDTNLKVDTKQNVTDVTDVSEKEKEKGLERVEQVESTKVEIIDVQPTKYEADVNTNKKQKSGFSNFSLPKPNFKLGFKSKKDKDTEKVKQIQTQGDTKKPSSKLTEPQDEIIVQSDILVEDSTKISFIPQKAIEENVKIDTVTPKEYKDKSISQVEQSEPMPKSSDRPTSEVISPESVAIHVSEKHEPKREYCLDTKNISKQLPTSTLGLDRKNEDDTKVESSKTENKSNEEITGAVSAESNVVTEQTDVSTKIVADDKIETLNSDHDKKVSETEKPSFIGKLKSNLPQICLQKSDSRNEGSGCLGKKHHERVEVTSKTVVAESVPEKPKQETDVEKASATETTLEKKKGKNLLEKFQAKKAQKEVVINDTHLYTDDSTLGRKKKNKIYIVENDLSEESPKKRFGKAKVKNQKASEESKKKEKQGELIVEADTLVTESIKLSKDGPPQETDEDQGRLSAFLEEAPGEGSTDQPTSEIEFGKNNIVLDANNKPVFNQSNVLEKEKSIENVQIATDVEKKKLVVDDRGNEVPVDESLQQSLQTSSPSRPTNAEADTQQTQTASKNLKWNQSPNKKSAFFSTVPAAASCHDDRKPLQFVVVAIDFGTTFSGYAFSFNRDIDSIHVMRKWEGGDPGVTNQKTPTTLLLDPNGQFHSFGFTARDFYHDLSPKEAQKWMYFEKFKMALHYNADLSAETEIKAANGRNFRALDVFSYALKFFRNHAIQEIGEQSNTPIYEEDIKWVITVPAIWKSPAKQFMRESAYRAGIAGPEKADRLLIALEPEAASVFVRKQRLKQLIPESEDDLKDSRSCQELSPPEHVDNITYHNGDDSSSHNQSLSSGVLNQSFQRCPSPTSFPVSVGPDVDITDNRFMVADCGGGTADITVYEMLSSTGGKLKELYKASGGPYGSIGVDLEFEKLLVSIFSADFIEAFKMKRPAGWVDLMMAFESRKRAANPFKSKPLNVPLPFSFIDHHKKFKNCSVETAIKKHNSKNVLWSTQGMLRLLPEAMHHLFQPTLDAIVQAIRKVVNQPDVAGVNNIFMVGGFSESAMLQQEIRKNFANQSRILIPNDVSLTILKGAVLFGIDPSVVVIRKSRLTYGLGVLNRFIEGKHPETKRALKDGESWCVDVFDPLVIADQSVALGSSVIRSYTPASSSQKFSLFHIFCSEDRNVDFVTEEGVAKCGTLRLDLDDHQWELESTPSRPVSQQISSQEAESTEVEGGARREIQARLTFGDTEIKLIALDVVTGNYVRATLDFLNK